MNDPSGVTYMGELTELMAVVSVHEEANARLQAEVGKSGINKCDGKSLILAGLIAMGVFGIFMK